MRIEKEGSAGFKVELTGCELQNYNLTYNQLDYKEQRTKSLLNALSRHAGAMMGFTGGEKLLIEVFPTPGKGCVIYFTSMGQKGKRYRRVLPKGFLFQSCTELYQGLECLGEIPGKSELYNKAGQYVLVLYGHRGEGLKEYAQPYPADRLSLAYLREHGTLLAGPDAVGEILRKK